jgi:eukaryotic-like serine/threonine-protein kinase
VGILDSFKKLFSSDDKSKKLPVFNIEKRFELLNRTGQGSMSKVWKAYDRKLGRTVCLKILDKEKTAKFEARFFKGLNKPPEGEVCMALKHKNVVQTFEYGLTTKKEPFLVMELVEGVGMNFLVETKSAQLEGNRVNYLVQLADSLEYLHKLGYLHRDMCPRNVMVNNEGVVKLIYFGLAIPYKPAYCKPGNRTGTTNYLAPELIKRQTTDHRVDMFALGVTAYELFTGDLPWEKGPSERLLRSMVNVPGRDPREIRPDLDKATAEFLIKAVDRDAKARFQKPAEFRDALKALAVQ